MSRPRDIQNAKAVGEPQTTSLNGSWSEANLDFGFQVLDLRCKRPVRALFDTRA
jgi:hypothetical protein